MLLKVWSVPLFYHKTCLKGGGGEGVGREENDFTTSTSRAKFFDRQEVGDFPLPCAARLVL